MNTLQYLMLAMSAVVIVVTPFMLVKAIRSGSKKRIFDFFVSDLLFFYVAVDVVWPSAVASAPRPMRLLIVVLCLVWIANFFGAFQRLFNQQKAASIERR